MTTQPKRNAIHFSDTLARDQAVVEETKLKMESNYDSMHEERTRLRDHTSKSRNTTWLTLFSIIAVFVSFFVMFFIIRFTR
jgi:heme/copper-type cytochrome/quinol oxidase subunit 3